MEEQSTAMSAVQANTPPEHAYDVTIEWLQSLHYQIQSASRPPTIEGAIVKDLRVNLDGRGDVIELWSRPWIEGEGLVMPAHVYQSATDYGVVNLQSHIYDAADEFKFPWDCVLEDVWEPKNG